MALCLHSLHVFEKPCHGLGSCEVPSLGDFIPYHVCVGHEMGDCHHPCQHRVLPEMMKGHDSLISIKISIDPKLAPSEHIISSELEELLT